ncbi:hypothetical protein HHK36_018727 [Tetracentron sinense]|uniref:RING-type domain-containing protein n=1 Tax=Tetracentron sinense TaxID=13715 RepID=A0A834YZX7_TETSI|nr:hypothetical protein HHK36_018727 [Tetracentron sinense]
MSSGEPPRVAAWSSLFGGRRDFEEGTKLTFEEPLFEDGNLILNRSEEQLEEGLAEWRSSLVGFFVGPKPSFYVMKSTVERIWKLKGAVEVFSLDNGFFIFKLNCVEDKERILEGGPWYIRNSPLILREWDRKVSLEKLDFKEMPVWVKIYNLPLFLWTSRDLGSLVSAIGVPLYPDKQTIHKSRLSYAKVCVEVNAEKELPERLSFSLNGEHGKDVYDLRFGYDWKPPRCAGCSVFGHTSESCPKKSSPPTHILNVRRRSRSCGRVRPVDGRGGNKRAEPDPSLLLRNNKEMERMEEGWNVVARNTNSLALADSDDALSWPRGPNVAESQPLDAENSDLHGVCRNVCEAIPNNLAQDSSGGDQEVRIKSLQPPMMWRASGLKPVTLPYPAPIVWVVSKGSGKKGRGIGDGHVLDLQMSSLAVWNVRGLNSPSRQCAVRELIDRNKLHLIGLVETKVRSVNADRDDSQFQVGILYRSDQVMHCEVVPINSHHGFILSVVYASNDENDRRLLWRNLIHFSRSINTPWLVCGDFNTILSPLEKVGGNGVSLSTCDLVNSSLDQAGLFDLRWRGARLTWSNKSIGPSRIASKLDRAMINIHWLQVFNASQASFLPPGLSDHSPIVITFCNGNPRGPRPFRFFNHWSSHHDFSRVVQEAWQIRVRGCPMFRLVEKLRNVKRALKTWSKTTLGDLASQINSIKEELHLVQDAIQSQTSDRDLHVREQHLCRELDKLMLDEESSLRQRSRVSWLKLGDRNNTFFHRSLISRRNHNRILSIQNADGATITNEKDIQAEALRFYSDLFGKEQGARLQPHLLVDHVLSTDDANALAIEVTVDEMPPQPHSAVLNQIWDVVHDLGMLRDTVGDRIVWTEAANGSYSLSSAWDLVRNRFAPVPWNSIIWFSENIPRQSFIAWMDFRESLLTLDKLLRRNIIQSSTCVFCRRYPETHNHLFFACRFTKNVWRSILRTSRIRHRPADVWHEEITWVINHFKGQGFVSKIKRLSLCATIYHIWTERNRRIFENHYYPAETIISKIIFDTRSRMSHTNVVLADSPSCREILDNWNIQVRFAPPSILWCQWRPPDEEIVAINTDGSLRNSIGSCGIIFRENTGCPLLGIAAGCHPSMVLQLELEAILIALTNAKERGFGKVSIRSDSKVAIDCLTSCQSHPWKALTDKISQDYGHTVCEMDSNLNVFDRISLLKDSAIMESSGSNRDSSASTNARRYGMHFSAATNIIQAPLSALLEYSGILRTSSSHQEEIEGSVTGRFRDRIQNRFGDSAAAAAAAAGGGGEEVSIRIIATGEQEHVSDGAGLPLPPSSLGLVREGNSGVNDLPLPAEQIAGTESAAAAAAALDHHGDAGNEGGAGEALSSYSSSSSAVHSGSNVMDGEAGNGVAGRDSSYQRFDIQQVARWIEQILPFSLLLLVVFIRQHLQGFFVTIWIAAVMFKSNDILRKQTALKEERKISVLVGITIVFILHVVGFYWWYRNDYLLYPLVMLPPKAIPPFWHAIFVIMVNDTMVRQAAMVLKCILLMYHKNSRGRNYRKQGQMLTLVEYLLLLYRALLPTPVWYRFFLNKEYGSLFSSLTTGLYLTFKLTSIVEKVQSFFAALKALSHKEVHYGSYATSEQGQQEEQEVEVNAAGDLCAICQEKMHAPILLCCKHIFCEDCVSE